MTRTTRRQTKTYNGFALPLQPDTQLGLAMLIAEDEDGHYEPVGVVSTIDEAREIASDDMTSRMRRVEDGESPLCPWAYKVWARGIDGEHRIACEIKAATQTTKR